MYYYKYMPRKTGRIVLQNQKLRWSTPALFNDAFDIQTELVANYDHDTVIQMTLAKSWESYCGKAPLVGPNIVSKMQEQLPALQRQQFEDRLRHGIPQLLKDLEGAIEVASQMVINQFATSKILCLSTIPHSIPLWAHYAESSKGIALRFKDLPGQDSPWKTGKPVQYSHDFPLVYDNQTLSDLISGQSRFLDQHDITHKMVYTKSLHWEHEKEWRIWSGEGRDPDADYEDLPFNPLELDAVILGCKMEYNDRLEFAQLTADLYPHARVLVAEKSRTQFCFEIAEYKG